MPGKKGHSCSAGSCDACLLLIPVDLLLLGTFLGAQDWMASGCSDCKVFSTLALGRKNPWIVFLELKSSAGG